MSLQRYVIAAVLASLVVSAPSFSQMSAAPSGAQVVPQSGCVKPDLPGKLASSARLAAFNREYAAYRDCTNRYVDATKKLANDSIAAGNAAVAEFNAFAQEIKAQNDADK